MFYSAILPFLLGLTASFIGGIPFGLVNLSIVHTSVNRSSREAFNIALGATSVETAFALASIFLGGVISSFVSTHTMIKSVMFLVILIAGLFFLLKKENEFSIRKDPQLSGYLRGVLLMLVSFQVVLLWVGFSAFFKSKDLLALNLLAISFFLPGVFIGKMLAYYLYDLLSIYIKNNSKKLAKNINKIIGILLLIISSIYLIQFITNLIS